VSGISHYIDNERTDYDAVVFYVHGLGLDQDDFEGVMSGRHRSLAPTLEGFYPTDTINEPISLDAHADALFDFVVSFVDELAPDRWAKPVCVVGFSTGAELVLRMVSKHSSDVRRYVDGVIALDPNVSLATCFISSKLAEIPLEEKELLRQLKTMGRKAGNLDDWFEFHWYLVRVMAKMRHRVRFLRGFAAETVAQYDKSYKALAGSLAAANRAQVRTSLRLSAHAGNEKFLGSSERSRIEKSCLLVRLGPTGTSHFGLLAPDWLLGEVNGFVKTLFPMS